MDWLLGELLQVLLGGVTAGKRLVHVYQHLGALLAPATLLGFVEQQYLALRQLADSLGVAVAGPDEGGVDVAPARRLSSSLSAMIRSRTQR